MFNGAHRLFNSEDAEKYSADPSLRSLSTPVRVRAPRVAKVAPHPSTSSSAAAATRGQYQMALKNMIRPEKIARILSSKKEPIRVLAKLLKRVKDEQAAIESASRIFKKSIVTYPSDFRRMSAEEIGRLDVERWIKGGSEKKSGVLGGLAKILGGAGLLTTAFFTGKEYQRIQKEKEDAARQQAAFRRNILHRMYGAGSR